MSAATFIKPQLALNGDVPVGDDWLYEIKWDGYRGVCHVVDGEVTLISRSGASTFTHRWPEAAAELATLPDCVIDGELVVLDGNGDSNFGSLGKGVGTFVAFDLIECLGNDLRGQPLTARRDVLNTLLSGRGFQRVAVSPTFDDPDALMELVRDRGLEGIVAKRGTSVYREGQRNADWLKIKVRHRQEFVVVGYTQGEGRRSGKAGSLLLGVYDGSELTYVGRVGTGGEDALWESFTTLPPPTVPIRLNGDVGTDDVTWLRPFVVEVEFQRWTADGYLWHPALVGVREDKAPAEVRRAA